MMHVLSVRVLEGPNIYSYAPVIKAIVDLENYEGVTTSDISGFAGNLTAILPGLAQHHCSRGQAGGFVERLHEGTYLGHVFEHMVLELQCLAGHEVNFGKTRGTGIPGIYHVIVGCHAVPVALAAFRMAENILHGVLEHRPVNVEGMVGSLRQTAGQCRLGPSTAALLAAAVRQGIPVHRVAGENMLILGYGCRQERLWTAMTGRTSAVAVDLACDKHLTNRVLAESGISVPLGRVADSPAGAREAMHDMGTPVAVKPVNGNQGKGVSLGVHTDADMDRAFLLARQFSGQVLVEEYIAGRQYRVCVVNGKMAAAAERIPAYVIGDGKHSVRNLIDFVNASPERGNGHEKPLTRLILDDAAEFVLAKQKLTADAVPESGRIVYIRENANLSTGGTAVDVTDVIHPDNASLAERAARQIGLDIAGVDLVALDITKPISPGTGAVIEVNAAPGLRMHHYPSAGKARDVAGQIIEYLYPDGQDGRIPVLAITGTNGKTTVTRMIGHIWGLAGYKVGMTTTDGIFINGRCVQAGDTTGPTSSRLVLHDPQVEVAVLEVARGGIVRGGLAYRQSDVGIVTNITEDHLGQDGIEDLDDLAFIKSLILETVRPTGYALLNADDPYVTALAERVQAQRVYFSIEPDNIVIRRHLGVGGKAFFVKEGVIFGADGGHSQPIIRIADIPVTWQGAAMHNVQNAVIAAAACAVSKLPITHIRHGLATFEQNPGRLTMETIGDFRVCVDYGHNPAGYQALVNTVRRLGASRLVAVIAAPGDRRDDVIVNVGRIAGLGFDRIIIKEDNDLRGRKPGEVAGLLRQGVLEAGMAPNRVETILAEPEAVRRSLESARSGDLIVVFYEKYQSVMNVIHQFRKEYRATQHDKVLQDQPSGMAETTPG